MEVMFKGEGMSSHQLNLGGPTGDHGVGEYRAATGDDLHGIGCTRINSGG